MNTTNTAPSHEQITRRAFRIWCENGRLSDTANDNWHAAERELEREREHKALDRAQDAQDALD